MTVVATTAGLVRGTTTVTRRADVESFLGVPFAAPPTGARRLRAPEPVEPWAGEREVKRYAPAAPQNPDPVLAQSGFWQPPHDEALCLNLNVWTPKADDGARPVMVWIHGGAYVSGSNSSGYNGGAELAAALGVVVVSINYRLGALGFVRLDHLTDGDYADAANVAVLDQLLALAWVRDNISAFGGDPRSVTLFGESAGGAAVGTLLGTPASNGLFRRAIIQSGTAERARAAEDSADVTAELLAALGSSSGDPTVLLEAPVERVLEAQARVVEAHADRTIGLPLPFQPTIDGRVLPLLPLEAIRQGVNADVELLAGTNLNEASFFTVMRPQRPGDATAAERFEQLFDEHSGGGALGRADYRDALERELGRQVSDDDLLESFLSDTLYRQPTNRLLDARAHATASTFAYLFTWPSPLMEGRLGACHALEVPFVFRQLHRIESASLVGEHPPVELSEWMSGAWVEFARRGAPGFPALPDWPVYEPDRRRTMVLDLEPRVVDDPRGGIREYWTPAVMAL